MTNRINTYKEVLEEEERLKQLLQVQKLQIEADIQGLKDELKPLTNFGITAKKFLTRKGTEAAAAFTIKLLIDGFVKNFILSKSGWFTRFIVPFFLKNYASHLAGKPETLVNKLKHLFGRNGKPVTQE